MSEKKLKEWEKQKKLIPVMIGKYCHHYHHTHGKRMCEECSELNEYALLRLDKCPFRENKPFCSACKVHCYKPDMREKIREVMRFSGPRMIWTHPVWSCEHVVQTIKAKKGI